MLTIKIVRMRIETPRLLQGRMKSKFAVLCEPRPSKFQTRGHHPDVAIS